MNAAARLSWLFVCRGSHTDGLGHVIRTRALIERLPAEAPAELIVIGDQLPGRLLEGLPIPCRSVSNDSEITQGVADGVDVVAFDTISLSTEAFESCAKLAGVTVSLSPIFDHIESVDLAFSRTRYGADGIEEGGNRRHGVRYAIVRSECTPIDTELYARTANEDPLSVAISMGGADAPNHTLEILDALREIAVPATFWVLLGEGYAHSYRNLVQCVGRDRRHEVILAKTNRSMWRILRNCNLAILAGGVTTYEAAYAGLPSINVIDEPGREFLVRELAERGAAIFGGTLENRDIGALQDAVDRLERDRDALVDMHLRGRALIDGRGADRVIWEIVSTVMSQRVAHEETPEAWATAH